MSIFAVNYLGGLDDFYICSIGIRQLQYFELDDFWNLQLDDSRFSCFTLFINKLFFSLPKKFFRVKWT
jgi:hypothetical protein